MSSRSNGQQQHPGKMENTHTRQNEDDCKFPNTAQKRTSVQVASRTSNDNGHRLNSKSHNNKRTAACPPRCTYLHTLRLSCSVERWLEIPFPMSFQRKLGAVLLMHRIRSRFPFYSLFSISTAAPFHQPRESSWFL